MVDLRVENLDALQERLGKRTGAIFKNVGDAMTAIGLDQISQMVRLHRAPPVVFPQRKSRSAPLSRITGGLMDSLDFRVKGQPSGDEPSITLTNFSAGTPYARVQEYGTVGAGGTLPDIVPVRARVLAVPLPAARTAAGDVRGGPRNYNGYWLKTTDNVLLFIEKATGKALFIGKQRVAIPPRMKYRETFRKNLPEHKKRIHAAVAKALRSP